MSAADKKQFYLDLNTTLFEAAQTEEERAAIQETLNLIEASTDADYES